MLIESSATKNNIRAFGPTKSIKDEKKLKPFGLILLRLVFSFLFTTKVLDSGSQTSRLSAPSGADTCLPVFLSLYHYNV